MDDKNFLVLINNEDRTAEVQSFRQQGAVVWVKFHNVLGEQRYHQKAFQVLQNPKVIDVSEKVMVYHQEKLLDNIKHMYDFGQKIRITFNSGKSYPYNSDSIRIAENIASLGTTKMLFDYWTAILENTRAQDDRYDEESFLKKEFAKLKPIHPDSVLYCYLTGKAIKARQPTTSHTIFPFQFNGSQKEALEQALRSQISIVEGPPGTGKTQTILNILANLTVMQNQTVAVVSGNNAAVQNVKEKLEAKGYPFLVASLGNMANREQFFADPPSPDVSTWKSEREEGEMLAQIQALNGRIQHLMDVEKRQAMLQQQLSAYRLEQEHFEAYYNQQDVEPIGKLSFYRETPERILSFLADHFVAAKLKQADKFLHKLKLVFQHGFLDIKRLKTNEIDVILSFQRKYYHMKIEQLTKQIQALQQELAQGSYKPLLQQHHQMSEQLFRHKLYQKYRVQAPISASASSYKKDFPKFMEQYPIVLSTTHSLRNCIPEHFLFDYVIIDESSQVDLLTGVLALSCAKNAIIVGDMKQLPQIVSMEIEEKLGAVKTGVSAEYDYFRQSLLSSMSALYGERVPRVLLKEHYRCHPRIIEFCNQKYYDGELVAFRTGGEAEQPLIIYHTAKGNHMREVTHGKRGKFNQRELDVIELEVLPNLEIDVEKHSDIGFITPYRKQVEKASQQLTADIESDTIHRYQGREKPTMILSTVLDQSAQGKKGMKFLNDPCKINVAVSRAQERFILVTDRSLFRKHNSEIGDLIRYMEYSTLDNNVIESEIVSVFDLLYKEYSEKLIPLRNRIVRSSKYESQNILWTLIPEILEEPPYRSLVCAEQVLVRNLLHDVDKLDDRERKFVNHQASVDFVIYHKLNKCPVLAIEADGFAYHENDPEQLVRDRMKDHIFEVYQLPLLRLATQGSREELKIREKLDEILNLEIR